MWTSNEQGLLNMSKLYFYIIIYNCTYKTPFHKSSHKYTIWVLFMSISTVDYLSTYFMIRMQLSYNMIHVYCRLIVAKHLKIDPIRKLLTLILNKFKQSIFYTMQMYVSKLEFKKHLSLKDWWLQRKWLTNV